MSFSLRAADCCSLLKSGSLLSVCAVIEKFQPPSFSLPSTLLCFALPLSILLSSPTSLTSLPPPQPAASPFLFQRLRFFSLFEFSVISGLTHSPPPPFPPSPLHAPPAELHDSDHLCPNHPLNQPLPADKERVEEVRIIQEDDVRGLDVAVVLMCLNTYASGPATCNVPK